MNNRTSRIERKSRETEITVSLNVDGKGLTKTQINSPIGLLNHMLELFAFHGLFDLELKVVKADTEIDIHHTNEDIGIVLGQAFLKALGEKQGIRRFGSGSSPMESVLGTTVIDLSGRGYLQINADGLVPETSAEGYTFSDFKHFLESFAHKLGANINVRISNPEGGSADLHTILETVFKSLGLALDQATQIDPRREGQVPSTKGIID